MNADAKTAASATTPGDQPNAAEAIYSLRGFLIVAALLLLLRIVTLVFALPELGPDEAQYWFWSETPQFGYYSKPPLIAWAIGATTAVFGDAEWAVRLSAPLFHTGAAFCLFLLARDMFGARAAFWSGVAWLTLPGVILSSTLITTDAPLLFFWSLALFSFYRMANGKRRTLWAAVLGIAIGLGFLSKYAMIYFPLGAAIAAVALPGARQQLRPMHLAIVAVIAAALIAPNVLWNADNDFQTVSHTAANANWAGDLFHPIAFLTFIVGQFGVAGPIFMLLMIYAASITLRTPQSLQDDAWRHRLLLLAFAAPPLLIVSVQAFLSRAHANWAAAAYPALTVLICSLFANSRLTTPMKAGLALHGAMLFVFTTLMTTNLADQIGLSGPLKPLRGWEEQGAVIDASAIDVDVIMTDERKLMGEIIYYARSARKRGVGIAAWNSNEKVDHHYEAFFPFDPEKHKRILFVTTYPDARELNDRFDTTERIGTVTTQLGGGEERTLYLFRLSNYNR